MDVVVDADILSTFAKVGKTGLLRRLFRKSKILITPAVHSEIREAIRTGLIASIPSGFLVVKLTLSEKTLLRELRRCTALSVADTQCLAVARNRKCLLLSNDKQVCGEAETMSVEHLSLSLLLRELWVSGVTSKESVLQLAREIERKDRVIIKNKGLIFR